MFGINVLQSCVLRSYQGFTKLCSCLTKLECCCSFIVAILVINNLSLATLDASFHGCGVMRRRGLHPPQLLLLLWLFPAGVQELSSLALESRAPPPDPSAKKHFHHNSAGFRTRGSLVDCGGKDLTLWLILRNRN